MTTRWLLHASGFLLLTLNLQLSASEPERRLTYEQDIRPILKAHCFQCHGEEEKPEGKLDLRLVRLMKQGGVSGESLIPGNHQDSFLWQRIDDEEMPPLDKKLPAKDKELIAAWIDQGAVTARPEPESLAPGVEPSDEEKAFWSFQPIRRQDPPRVQNEALVRVPIDAFLLEKLEKENLGFSPEADRRTLIRRVSFTLTGLPPTPTEVDQFLADNDANAYERLVDRLLASPRYGERWARHWLDVAGYADSDGYSPKDAERKYAYKYRDYLIRSLNLDRPWDELIREQLAGDEMLTPPYQDLAPEALDKLVATGFLRMAPDGSSDPAAEQALARNDTIAETIKIVSTSMLGLTIGCAQCHAHRYDPIPADDYYRFRALFEPAYNPKNWRSPTARLISLWTADERSRAASVDAEVKAIDLERAKAVAALVKKVFEQELAEAPEELRGKLREACDTPKSQRSAEQKQWLKTYPRLNVLPGNVSLYDAKAFNALTKDFAAKVAKAREKRPSEDFVHALTEVPGQVPTTNLFFRGDIQQPRQAVLPGELKVLTASSEASDIPVDDPALPTTGRRLAYARHLTSGKHPLVARVLVNRVWLHHFGRGIVNTPGDFGMLGERPSHPALLDWLADEFMSQGWSLKKLHRLILTSTAYRQSSRRDPKLESVDPDDRLLGRMPVRRLEAEAVRDAMLAASGRLTPTMYGPPVPVAIDEAGQVIVGLDNRDGAGRPVSKRASIGNEEWRRSLYIQVRRSLPLGLLETFDAPPMAPNCEQRASSTVAPQSLMMMNNDFVVQQAETFATRVALEAGDDPKAQVQLAWRLALALDPDPEAVESAVRFLASQQEDFAATREAKPASKSSPKVNPAHQALATFCQALFGSNAFLYVD
ncbi:PSD1 and planctomycete cytochrome C domain-containing protein [Singulisphaera sp. Ch08]|uniref:PSD1 and planctomycete cytochrome C domain-containing protein n=1 Tax=Singulisphaera sp. Ch08 TaxID=3120278 RepID=A0AAU7C7U2_9BACT